MSCVLKESTIESISTSRFDVRYGKESIFYVHVSKILTHMYLLVSSQGWPLIEHIHIYPLPYDYLFP